MKFQFFCRSFQFIKNWSHFYIFDLFIKSKSKRQKSNDKRKIEIAIENTEVSKISNEIKSTKSDQIK